MNAEPFAPVATLDDLYTLDADQILDGYRSWNRGDPEPGANHGRAYWHGWCNAARDNLERPATAASAQLACVYANAVSHRVTVADICDQPGQAAEMIAAQDGISFADAMKRVEAWLIVNDGGTP